jgi:hypothetical protein
MILWSMLLAGAYGLCCVAMGRLVFRLLRRGLDPFVSPLAELAGAFLVGLAVLGNLWLVISVLPGRWFLWPVVGGICAAVLFAGGWGGLKLIAAGARQLGRSLQTLYADRSGVLEENISPGLRVRRFFDDPIWAMKILVPPTLVLGLLYFFASALPPKGDGEMFYMVIAKILAHTGRLEIPPNWQMFVSIGLHGELHFGALMSLGSWQAGMLLVFLVSLAGVAVAAEIARRVGLGLAGRWVLVILMVCSTAWTRVIPGGKVDLFGSALCLGAIYLALAIRPGRWIAPSLLVGLLVGAGVIAKLTLAVTVVPMIALLVTWRVLLAEAPVARPLAVLVGCAVLVVLGTGPAVGPHMAKDAVLLGDPWFPVMATAQSTQSGEMLQRSAYLVDTLRHIYPLALFLGKMDMLGRLSAAGLALLPVVLVLPRPGRIRAWLQSPFVQIAVVTLAGLACWATLYFRLIMPRYLLPPLVLLLLLPAAGAGYVLRNPEAGRALRFGVILVLTLALAERLNRPKGHPGDGLKFIFGSADLTEVAGSPGRMCLLANTVAGPGDRVLTVTGERFHLRPGLLRTASLYSLPSRLGELPTQADRWRWLEANGWRVILVSPPFGQIKPTGRLLVPRRDGSLLLDSQTVPAELILRQVGVDSHRPGEYGVYVLRARSAAPQPTTGESR